MAASPDDLQQFWSQAGHKGDPASWSDSALLSWLQTHTGEATSTLRTRSRRQQEQQATAALDRLYDSNKPPFAAKVKPRSLDPASLLLWVPREQQEDNVGAAAGLLGAAVRSAGRMERDFKSMYNLAEMMQYVGRELPMGLSPEDDLRQNLVVAAQVFDAGNRSILLQTSTLDDAVSLYISRGVLLLNNKFKAGDRVIVLSEAVTSSSSSTSSSNRAGADALPGSIGTVVEQLSEAAGGAAAASTSIPVLFDGSAAPAQVAADRLLLLEPQQSPQQGSYVVLHSLKQQPELAGRLARVINLRTAAPGGSSSDTRCEVTLVRRLADEPAGRSSSSQLQLRHLSPRLACVAAVQQPTAALLVAFAAHNSKTPAASAAARRFMQSQIVHLAPMQNIRTTQREQRLMRRYIDKTAAMLGPCSKALKQQLLGPLNPQLWELALLMPIKAPLEPADQHRRALKKQLVCRLCGKEGTKEQPVKFCQSCHAVTYCSRECQVADWKARHKAECGKGANGSVSGGAGSSSSSSSTAPCSVSPATVSTPASILVPLGQPPAGTDAQLMPYLMVGGKPYDMTKVPENIYGNKEFVVKLSFQPSLPSSVTQSQAGLQGGVMLYDRARSLIALVAAGQPGHAELMHVMQSAGRPGRLNPYSHVTYVWATREDRSVRVYLQGLPEQEQPW